MKIILASSSPRRAEILRDAGIAFEISATHIDEAALRGETAQAMVARLAEAKARAAAAQMDAGSRECIIVGADTTVELDGEILGKPSDAAHIMNQSTADCCPGLRTASLTHAILVRTIWPLILRSGQQSQMIRNKGETSADCDPIVQISG